MNAIRTPSLVVAYWIGGEIGQIIDDLTVNAVRPHASAESFQRETWAAFAPSESQPNPTLVVLENQEHIAVEGGRDVLANIIIKFSAAQD